MLSMFEPNLSKTRARRYYFIPNGRNGKDVFMPADKVSSDDLNFPIICMDYEGPPIVGSSRYLISLSHNGSRIAAPTGSHFGLKDSLEDSLKRDVGEFLKIAREYLDRMRASND
jgi:hypothetical protein